MGDWVVQDESYPNLSNTIGAFQRLGFNTFAGVPLTVQNYLVNNVGQERYREEQSTTRTLAVRGVIHWWRDGENVTGTQTFWEGNWMSEVVCRIAVNTTDPIDQTTVVPPDNYSLRQAATANQDFLWESRQTYGNIQQSQWTGQPAVRSPWYNTIDVHCKVGRVLRPLDQLVLWCAWLELPTIVPGPVDGSPNNQTSITFYPRLRTYVR